MTPNILLEACGTILSEQEIKKDRRSPTADGSVPAEPRFQHREVSLGLHEETETVQTA